MYNFSLHLTVVASSSHQGWRRVM